MTLSDLLEALGEEIQDAEEESFLLFSQAIPSQNLGFIDPKATSLDITVAGRDLTIQQSPTLLSSNRKEGTTGAVVWKITPLLADWISSQTNILFQTRILNSSSTVLELGCGVSGIVALALSPRISKYIATDQQYVFKSLSRNITTNLLLPRQPKSAKKRKANPAATTQAPDPAAQSNIRILPLDWESTLLSSLPDLSPLTLVLACDCIYNESLITPFVRTCADLCLLPTPRTTTTSTSTSASAPAPPTLCLVAQQLRSHAVFESWLHAFRTAFRVWRVPARLLGEGMGDGSGFAVHVGVLRGC